MRSLNAAFQTEKNKDQNFPITLYDMQIDDTTTIYLAETNDDIVFDGKTYLAFPVKRGNIGQNADGQIDMMTVQISNVSLEMSAFAGSNDLRDNLLRVTTVFYDTLSNSSSKIATDFYIKSYSINENEISINVGTKLDVLDIIIPKRTYGRTVCSWIYKGAECKYAGVMPTCDKGLDTPNGCREHSNTVNFSGFPDVPLPARLIFA